MSVLNTTITAVSALISGALGALFTARLQRTQHRRELQKLRREHDLALSQAEKARREENKQGTLEALTNARLALRMWLVMVHRGFEDLEAGRSLDVLAMEEQLQQLTQDFVTAVYRSAEKGLGLHLFSATAGARTSAADRFTADSAAVRRDLLALAAGETVTGGAHAVLTHARQVHERLNTILIMQMEFLTSDRVSEFHAGPQVLRF